ncbi:hypothetical protein [Sphingomonas sp. Leaf33]|uniref:hypothetical protein n=1 Tax=Sphingomonas sp. Leaf33 TaxID=1736215 RepID=UPI0012E20B24|nr:hypothetical protein [Sphingomonas sp. Leaf33]
MLETGEAMSVAKIVAGVVIGNLITAVILWLIASFMVESWKADAIVDRANQQYEAMNSTN